MKKIVLTGGPCAGKTTVLEVLRREFVGEAEIVPEVATILLTGGFPVPGEDVDWSPEWQAAFQTAILPVQIQLEKACELKAAQREKSLLVCDRGLLDGAAYTPGGTKAFCEIYKVDPQEALGRYAAIIHLESVAVGEPEVYNKVNNSKRFETLEEAQKLECATREVWKPHPGFRPIGCEEGIEGKIRRAIEIVRQTLNQERG